MRIVGGGGNCYRVWKDEGMSVPGQVLELVETFGRNGFLLEAKN